MDISMDLFEDRHVEFCRIDDMVLTKRVTPEILQKVKDFQPHSSDILCASYPKAGQTWLMTIVYLMDNADKLQEGEPIEEFTLKYMNYAEMLYPDKKCGVDIISEQPSPRVIKTHLPLRYWQQQLEKDPEIKVIQVLRNPKDTLVSLYHFYRMHKGLGLFIGTWEDFFEMVKKDEVIYGDQFSLMTDWYKFNKSKKNSLILFYEDMKINLRYNVLKIAQFLSKSLSDEIIDIITSKVTFENMEKDATLNSQNFPAFDFTRSKFLRKGTVGDWQEYFNNDQNAYIKKKCIEILHPNGIHFNFITEGLND